jgi:hypothetical protein
MMCLLFAASEAALPVQDVKLKMTIANAHREGRLSVRIEGGPADSFRIWKSGNSWGAALWRVAVLRQGELNYFYQDPEQIFTRNFPAYEEYFGPATFDLDLNRADWLTNVPRPFSLSPGDIIVVIFEVAPSPEAEKSLVWTGSLATHEALSQGSFGKH